MLLRSWTEETLFKGDDRDGAERGELWGDLYPARVEWADRPVAEFLGKKRSVCCLITLQAAGCTPPCTCLAPAPPPETLRCQERASLATR